MIDKITLQFISLTVISTFTFAQSGKDSLKNDWSTNWIISADAEWNDNVYKLSPSQKSRMDLNDSGDVTSGRFRDMESINDLIFSFVPEFEVKKKSGLFNRTLSFTGLIDYQHYVENTKRSNFKFGLSVQQSVSKIGKVTLQGEYTPSYFVKNYLTDATDTSGHVSSDKRIYREAIYNELELLLGYHHHFRKWIIDVKGDLLIGYRNKKYDDWFTGRNQDALGAGLDFEIEPAKRWLVNLGYYFESVNSPVTKEVMILDEPDYQIDFNNDRDFADNNRRTEQTVDRSRYSQTLKFGLQVIPIKSLTLHLEFKYRFKDYTSKEPIDPNYKDREDSKTKLEAGFDYKIFKDFFLVFKYETATQKTNRPADPESDGEITDYHVHRTKVGVQWQL